MLSRTFHSCSRAHPRASSLALFAGALLALLACGGDPGKRRPEPDGSQPGRDGAAELDDGSSGGPSDGGEAPSDSAVPARDSGEDGGEGPSDAARPGDASGPLEDSGQDGAVPLMAGDSIEVARIRFGNDYATRSDAPRGGTLFSVWTKIPDEPTGYPWQRGNMDVYVLYGTNWHLRCLVGNMGAEAPDNARYAANTMLFAAPAGNESNFIEDYGYYESSGVRGSDGLPILRDEALFRGWVWVAWWVVVRDDKFIIQQWLKFGVDGDIIEDDPTHREAPLSFARQRLRDNYGWSAEEAAAWVPSDATGFQVGYEQGYLTHARMEARSTEPTKAELEAIAMHTVADETAWADYPFVWTPSGPYLQDQSGHGRHLSLRPGGTFYPGPDGPL